jgi:hypothetical protein
MPIAAQEPRDNNASKRLFNRLNAILSPHLSQHSLSQILTTRIYYTICWDNASESPPVLCCAHALVYLPTAALYSLYYPCYCAALACELAVGVGCAAMGCVDTERDWLGYKFVPLFIYCSGSDIVYRT